MKSAKIEKQLEKARAALSRLTKACMPHTSVPAAAAAAALPLLPRQQPPALPVVLQQQQ